MNQQQEPVNLQTLLNLHNYFVAQVPEKSTKVKEIIEHLETHIHLAITAIRIDKKGSIIQ